jgi:hypothetical protein
MIERDDAEILVREELVAVTTEALAALRERGGVYVRGRMLVQLGQSDGLEDPATRLVRPAGAPVIVPVTAAALRSALDESARWVKAVGRKAQGRAAALPPAWVAEQILHRTSWPFPPLEGVVATPVLRPDGSVLATPGYDPATGLYYEPIGTFPLVPEHPTREQVGDAVRTLLQPFAEFPFTDPCGRAAVVALILSLVGRYVITGPVPGFGISSPTAGTGKGLLARVAGIIGTGRPGALMSQAREDDELRKRILAIALAATPLVLLDNLSGVLGSDVLAAALTTTVWSDRMLGVSTVVDAPLRTVWVFTGNNLSFKKTLGRRIVPIYLDAGVEHPEDRAFAIENLEAFVHGDRPGLITAALTILTAYATAGRPRHAAPRMGSFEAWDDWVRGACIWAGLADPAQADDPLVGRGRIRSTLDEDRETLGAALASLAGVFGDAAFTAAQVAERATTDAALHLALEEIGASNKSGAVTARAIGYRFRVAESRIVDGLQLVMHRQQRTGRLWRVARASAAMAAMRADVLGPFARGKYVLPEGEGSETSPLIAAIAAGGRLPGARHSHGEHHDAGAEHQHHDHDAGAEHQHRDPEIPLPEGPPVEDDELLSEGPLDGGDGDCERDERAGIEGGA